MKDRIKIKDLKVKSFITTREVNAKVKAKAKNGGYTWVG